MSNKPSIVPLALPPELHKEIRTAAKRTNFSQADVMRAGLRIGVPVFVNRNCPVPAKSTGK